jgi:hypothetical protein
MAIARKPQTLAKTSVDIDALINRGGEPANGNGRTGADQRLAKKAPKAAPPAGVTPVIIRVPDETLRAIDNQVEARAVKTPRHTWLLEAIAEKLTREQSNGKH